MARVRLLGLLLLVGMPAWFALSPAARSDKPPEPSLRPKPVVPPSAETIREALRRGVAFLVKDQNKDGSWGTPNRTKDLNIYAPVPDAHQAFRAAVTALCVSALIDTAVDTDEARAALERGEAWILKHVPQLRRSSADTLYNIWGHIYGIDCLVRMHQRLPRDAERRRKIEGLLREQIELLVRFESVEGGWGYYDMSIGAQHPASATTSFMSAAGLISLHAAKAIGVNPPAPLVKHASDSILRQRKKDFSYLYGEYLRWRPMMPVNRPGGSLGRSQACNLAMRLWGDTRVTDEVVKNWLDRLFSRNLWLDMGRKRPIPHESHFQVAGYFYFFGHYYAAGCIEQLPPAERPFYQDQLAHVLLPLQEKDGSWWDFPLYNYHQQYGTAFALMTLKHCEHAPVKPLPDH